MEQNATGVTQTMSLTTRGYLGKRRPQTMVDVNAIMHRAAMNYHNSRGNNVKGTSTNKSLKRMLAKAPKGTRLDR